VRDVGVSDTRWLSWQLWTMACMSLTVWRGCVGVTSIMLAWTCSYCVQWRNVY